LNQTKKQGVACDALGLGAVCLLPVTG
jgi:hypothetical protein